MTKTVWKWVVSAIAILLAIMVIYSYVGPEEVDHHSDHALDEYEKAREERSG
ncbi:hypothetical protein N0O92_10420 [Alkalihalobacillus sp. MEB130]|uniref:hypothetical protein n=1 Tax=Alkalihalobacillus sp. MEB130 TaxID=2976704 RepID=UPI0028DE74D7|nr:hypothetical protein [Alkalihalobacillus sp. MEB130]MDT8860647.1 hypothetical protein [Alkalihalobacillus sp. MEB130]